MPDTNKEPDFFDTLRTTEFSRLDAERQVYLDYTGSGLYPESLLRNHFDTLQKNVLGNPHSDNPTSQHSTALVEQTRADVLSFFNADPRKYDLVFTANSSSALKIVGESYPFTRSSTFALLEDNHNSVNGIREYAAAAGAKVHYLPLDDDLRASHDLEHRLHKRNKDANNLFAYPAQSNFSGVKHPLFLVHLAHTLGYHVLLDTAAFVPTNRLDLSTAKPEFLCVSFYKMFGFPTGIGALIAKKDALRMLNKRWFAGGTVKYVSVQNRRHLLQDSGPAAFEDGTINFLGIPAIRSGLAFLKEIGMDRIGTHVKGLTRHLIRGLLALRHDNGHTMVQLHGPRSGSRGGTVNFDFLNASGEKVDARVVEKAANEKNISMRTGCFCNPGAAERAYGLEPKRALKCMVKTQRSGPFSVEKFSRCCEDVFLGSIRVSLGIASCKRDVDFLLEFLKDFAQDYEKYRAKVAELESVTDEDGETERKLRGDFGKFRIRNH